MFPYTFCLLINTKGGYFGLSFIFFFKKLKKFSHLFISQMIVQFCYLRVHLGIGLFTAVRCNGWQRDGVELPNLQVLMLCSQK